MGVRVAVVVGVLALALPGSASAAGTRCGSLTRAGWKAGDIRATHLTCRSARRKLRRWPPPPLPSNAYGWNCFPFRGRRMCAVGQGDAPRFPFQLRRVVVGALAARAAATASADICRPSTTCLNSAAHATRALTSSAYVVWASGAGARAASRIGRP